MAQGLNFFTNGTEVTPTEDDTWRDVDVSALVPSGTTGVLLHIENAATATQYKCDVRKNGSTDDDYANSMIRPERHVFRIVGVDSNRIFEACVQNASVNIFLIGYTDRLVVLRDNKVDVTPGTADSWQDLNLAAYIPANASGAIFKLVNSHTSSSLILSVRKDGSSDSPAAGCKVGYYGLTNLLCGVVNRVCEGYSDDLSYAKIYLVGYTLSPVVFFTNAIEVSPSATGSWLDVDVTIQTSPKAVAVMMAIGNTDTTTARSGSVRNNGSTDDKKNNIGGNEHIGAFIGLDGGQVYEAYESIAGVEFRIMGYCQPEAGRTHSEGARFSASNPPDSALLSSL